MSYYATIYQLYYIICTYIIAYTIVLCHTIYYYIISLDYISYIMLNITYKHIDNNIIMLLQYINYTI